MEFNRIKIVWNHVNDDIENINPLLYSESDVSGRILEVDIPSIRGNTEYQLHLFWQSKLKADYLSVDVFSREDNKFVLTLPNTMNKSGSDLKCILQLTGENKIVNSKPFTLSKISGVDDTRLELNEWFTSLQQLLLDGKQGIIISKEEPNTTNLTKNTLWYQDIGG